MWRLGLHLVVKDLGLARLGFGNQRLVQHIQHILANFLQLRLDLLAIVADGAHMLIRSLGFFFLLNRRDDAPRSTSSSNHILVGDRQQVSFIDSQLSTQLEKVRYAA